MDISNKLCEIQGPQIETINRIIKWLKQIDLYKII